MHNFQFTDRKPAVRPAPPKSDEAQGVPATRLCLSCGICCEGFLHTRATLRPEEREQADRHGLQLIEKDELSFALPCPRFAGCCTIFGDRPRVCGSFRCSLLRRLEADEIGIEHGIAIVEEARRLISEAKEATAANDVAERFQMHRRAAPNPDSAAEWLKLRALAVYLDKHFVLSRDGHFHRVTVIENKSKGSAS